MLIPDSGCIGACQEACTAIGMSKAEHRMLKEALPRIPLLRPDVQRPAVRPRIPLPRPARWTLHRLRHPPNGVSSLGVGRERPVSLGMSAQGWEVVRTRGEFR